MFKRFTAITWLLLALVALAACSPATGGVLPTNTPVPPQSTATPVAQPTSTPEVKPTDTTAPTEAPTGTPVPATGTPTANGGEAPSFEQIRAEIAKIMAQGGDTFTAIQAYADTLKGMTLTDREGWLQQRPIKQEDGTYTAVVYGEDPYSPEALASQQITGELGLLEIYLNNFPADLANLYAGTKVQFSGAIDSAGWSISVQVAVNATAVRAVDATTSDMNGTGPAIPTPLPAQTVTPGGDAPSISEILSNTQTLTGEDLTNYLNSLDGKTVSDWQGWIFIRNGGQWYLSFTDPYTNNTTALPADRFSDPGTQVLFLLETAENNRLLHQGQLVRFSGTLQARSGEFPPTLAIVGATATVVEDRLSGLTAPSDLEGVEMYIERTACFGACPMYSITVYGNGTVVWYGERFVAAHGYRVTTVSEGTVRALLAAYTRAGYTNLNDEYTQMRVTDLPSVLTSLSQGGQVKRINHYMGDLTAPARLVILENLFTELIDVSSWIGK